MEVAYKYCCRSGIEILRTLELKITPPNQFNDPFEFFPRVICSNPVRRSRKILKTKRHLKGFYEAHKEAGAFVGNFREYRRQAKEKREQAVQQLAGWLLEAADDSRRHLLDRVSQRCGILCLSKTRESILMWGHYCDKHQGIVIGFNASYFNKGLVPRLVPVEYVHERALFDASWLEGSSEMHALEKELVFSKNSDWSYEQELRQMFMLSALLQRPLRDGRPGYFLRLHPDAFVSVTLGARCPDDLAKEVASALTDPRLAHLTLERAALHDNEFALRFIPRIAGAA